MDYSPYSSQHFHPSHPLFIHETDNEAFLLQVIIGAQYFVVHCSLHLLMPPAEELPAQSVRLYLNSEIKRLQDAIPRFVVLMSDVDS